MGSSSQENGSGKKARRIASETGDSLGLLGNEDLSSLFANSLTAPGPARTEEPDGEEIYNSGELDLRSMADAYFRQRAGTAEEQMADEVPMLAPSEILIPTAAADRRSSGLPVAIAAVLGLFLIAGTVLATLLIMDRGDSNAQAQPAAAAEVPATETAPAVAPEPIAAAPAPVAVEPPPAEAAQPEPEMVFEPQPAADKREPASDDEESREARRERRERREAARAEAEKRDDAEPRSRIDVLEEMRASKQGEAAEKAAELAKQPEVARDPEPAKPKCDEVACLVNPSDPCCAGVAGSKREAKAEKAAASDLPEKLTSADVNAGIGKVRGRIGACGTKHGFQGVAKFKLTIDGDGSVKSAAVDAGNAEFKSCVTDKLESAKFKQTQKGLTVAYPFVFR